MHLPTLRWRTAAVAVIVSLVILHDSVAAAHAEVPVDPAAREIIVGRPVALTVTPSSIVLNDERDWAQLLVTGNYLDGSVRDLTAFCDLECSPLDLVSIDAGCLIPRKTGRRAFADSSGWPRNNDSSRSSPGRISDKFSARIDRRTQCRWLQPGRLPRISQRQEWLPTQPPGL